MDAETQAYESARTELHSMLDGNPSPEKAALIHKALGLMPSPHRGMHPESADPVTEDERLGIANLPQKRPASIAENFSTDPAYDNSPVGQRERDAAAVNPNKKPQTELEADPLLQEGVSQAGLLGALGAIGEALGRPAKAVLESRGGQAAEFLKSRGLPIREPFRPFGATEEPFVPTAKVEGGPMFGKNAEDAIAKLEKMKADGVGGDELDAEINRIRSASSASAADSEVARARGILKMKGPHVGLSGVHVPGEAIPAIVGHLTVPAQIAAAVGSGIANPVTRASAFMASPLMRAIFADKKPQLPGYEGVPASPIGGTR